MYFTPHINTHYGQQRILAVGSCHIDRSIEVLPGPEAYDTATIIVEYENGRTATIDVCRQAPYGYDQRAEALGTKGMIQTDNMYPNTARMYLKDFTGNADMPYDFFMSRYKEAYVQETVAFCMSVAAGMSAEQGRWVEFSEIPEVKACKDPLHCDIINPIEFALEASHK
jgi:myo-inositol 2-dehydrogenase / D-chiro-inositol 1-dehydrogenase